MCMLMSLVKAQTLAPVPTAAPTPPTMTSGPPSGNGGSETPEAGPPVLPGTAPIATVTPIYPTTQGKK